MIRGVNPLLLVGDFPGLVVTESSYNLNLRELWDAANPGMTPVGPIRITIASGVVIGSDSTDNPALVTGSWPSNVTLTLTNNGRIQGRGGNSGQAGGPALQATGPLSLQNNGGIWGGGGGGGRGSSGSGTVGRFDDDPEGGQCYSEPVTAFGGAGGGGAGSLPGSPRGTSTSGGSGDPGQTITSTGMCGSWGTGAQGGPGGRGGDPGLPGQGAGGGSAGSAGASVIGNNYITWVAEGDRRGPIT